jgi:hypothetical protein
MRFNPTPLNMTLLAFVLLTLWLITIRQRKSPEITWPLFYYFGLIVLANYIPGEFNLNMVYAGLIFALLLRFEFMSRKVTKFVRVAETILLAYYAYAALRIMF